VVSWPCGRGVSEVLVPWQCSGALSAQKNAMCAPPDCELQNFAHMPVAESGVLSIGREPTILNFSQGHEN
jgi:hypothetical protein